MTFISVLSGRLSLLLLDKLLNGHHALSNHKELIIIVINGTRSNHNHVLEQFLAKNTLTIAGCKSENKISVCQIIVKGSVNKTIVSYANCDSAVNALILGEAEGAKKCVT